MRTIRWNTTSPLPAPLSQHGASLIGDYVYITEGNDNVELLKTCISAPVLTDKTLGSWLSFASLPVGLYQHGQAVTDNFLYVSGGNNGAQGRARCTTWPCRIIEGLEHESPVLSRVDDQEAVATIAYPIVIIEAI